MSSPSEQRTLARLGEQVRTRMLADPTITKVPVDRADLFTLGGFLDQGECARLIAMIDDAAQPSRLYGGEQEGAFRTSYSSDLDATDSFVRMMDRRIADLLGIDLLWGETIQGQRYMPGQEFRAHHDWFYTTGDYWADEERMGGQRSWTAMVYLNDVEEGGETVFERVGASVSPQAGALLAWNNMLPDGTPNPNTLHAALPVVRGVKYVITKWFRARRWG